MKRRTCFASLGLIGLFTWSADAEQLALDFQLAPPTPSVNTVPITVRVTYDTHFPFVGKVTASDTDSSTVSGNALANLNLTFDNTGNVATYNTIAFTGGRVDFDDDLALNLNFLGLASAAINASDLSGILTSPLGPAAITANSFSLANSVLTIDQGNMHVVGSGLASNINQTYDFATDALPAPLNGTASLGVTLDQIVNGVGHYTATITAPFSFNQTIDFDADTSATLSIAFAAFTGPGNGPSANPAADLDHDNDVDDADFGLAFAAFTGPGATSSVPEPASMMALALAGLCVMRRRRA